RPVQGSPGGGRHARPQSGAQPTWAQRQGRPDGRGPADGQAPERPIPVQRSASGLPKRVRQASLAPQLKKDPAPQTEADRYPADTDPEREAEQARATMASLQRGWQRGRRQTATGDGRADTAPGTTYEGDGR
ncbi:histidine kinase, partial [Streptomyces sparsogenes]